MRYGAQLTDKIYHQNPVRHAFLRQANSCRHLGSPFTARLCELMATRLDDKSEVGKTILGWPQDASSDGDALGLRLCGALHALAIEKDDLAASYPPHHHSIDDDRLWLAIETTLKTRTAFILERIKSPPQTNEIRRSSIMLPALLTISWLTGLPLVLSELCASMGLNLCLDRFSYQLGDFKWGDPTSSVKLKSKWSGPEMDHAPLEISARAGCDLNPLDPARIDDQNRMLSYIWPDQLERLERTRAAINMAASSGHKVEKVDAVEWLEKRLAVDQYNSAHVIFHTIAWQYLPKYAQAEGRRLIEEAGKTASAKSPLAWLRFEADGKSPGAALRLTLWPTGEEHFLARADFHGQWIDWRGWPM